MKQHTIGTFTAREDAEKAINEVHNKLNIPNEDISYLYRNTEGETHHVPAHEIATPTPAEGAASGIAIGGTIGALAGIAAVAGVLPVLGPILAAGWLATALGITGAVGVTAAGAVTGAAAGGVIGALANIGVGQENAQRYADRVNAGDVLVAVHADESVDVAGVLRSCGAPEVNTYRLTV
jgi:hypothetical protein